MGVGGVRTLFKKHPRLAEKGIRALGFRVLWLRVLGFGGLGYLVLYWGCVGLHKRASGK